MFEVQRAEGAIPTLELRDTERPSLAVLAPSRGGMVTRFDVAGRPVLYLDAATFLDRAANVRGGVPVLFPSPGKLEQDAWSRGGRGGSMKQHGFARSLPWEVVSTDTSGAARVALRLSSDAATLAQYPFAFEALFRYSLAGETLRIEQTFTSRAGDPMPFGAGFHPYFAVPASEKTRVTIPTKATLVFDNTAKREGPFEGFDFTRAEVDLHLIDHGSTSAALELPDGSRIVVRASPEFTHWVVWSLSGRDFICLEPWTCPGNALNMGERLLELSPGASRTLWVELSLRT